MNIGQDDIIVRTFQNTPTVWVSERFICNTLGDDTADYFRKFARPTYKKSVSPCHRTKDILPVTGKSWRYARIDGRFYYDYDYIPDRKDTQYRSRLGDKDTLLHLADMAKAENREISLKEAENYLIQKVTNRVSRMDIEYYLFKKVDGVCKFNQDMARDMAEALQWMRVAREMTDSKAYRELDIKRQEDFFNLCGSILDRRKLYGFTITTGGSFRKKLIYFPMDENGQREYLISGRFGNDNARRLGRERLVDTTTGEIYNFDMHQAIILDLWMNPGGAGKGSKIELWNQYQDDIAYMGLDPMSYSTFCHYTNSYDTEFNTTSERHGTGFFNKVCLPYISSDKPVHSNSLWCADGSGTIGYKYIDKDGDLRSMRLYVMLVSDVATGKIVGWCPSAPGFHNESPYMMKQAMLMALQGCNKHEVMELVSDNHGAFTSDESKAFLGLVCRHYRTIESGNSQSNYAETQFRLFKKRFRRMTNWMGSSWDAKSIESQNNEDYTNIEDFPTYEEAIAQLEAKINEWNESKTHVGLTRSEMYAENLHPKCKQIDERIWRKLTGRYSSKEITHQRGTIQLERKGTIYKFDIPDFEVLGDLVREYLGYASLVQTDIYWDDECADVYTKDGRYMFSCYPTPKAAITHAEATDENMAAIGKGMIRKAKVLNKVQSFTEEAKTVAEAIYNEYPERYGNVCRQTKHAKERSNAEREKALEAKAKQNSRKARKKPVPVASDTSGDMDEYMRMREKLYK
ncbi:hypothetical protein NXY11_01755 [Parabacteroides faecis]|uniref:hypothetical protein n=1 Tax=Parabacteroides faecis TaxID=1217282 RepID=UPI002164A486|nr:hypothetical protein [Parabacteroides faecis]MCS2894411.1 hypothetical protein [Parabacteroides faecis]UVQ47002.1 hypothetical protein NXY11_01755 [Parabacteroides faecis]